MGHILFLLTIIMKPPPETLQGNSNLSNAILSVAIPSFLLKITREFVSRANPLKKTKDAATATAAAAANSSNAIQSINRMRALVLLPRSLMAAGIAAAAAFRSKHTELLPKVSTSVESTPNATSAVSPTDKLSTSVESTPNATSVVSPTDKVSTSVESTPNATSEVSPTDKVSTSVESTPNATSVESPTEVALLQETIRMLQKTISDMESEANRKLKSEANKKISKHEMEDHRRKILNRIEANNITQQKENIPCDSNDSSPITSAIIKARDTSGNIMIIGCLSKLIWDIFSSGFPK